MGRLFLPLLAFFPIVSSGQDGAQLYTTYCAACHAADGKGATVGTFPPLAGSPFAAGAPDRAAKIVIKGLERRTVNSPPAGQNVVHPSKTRALPENARFTGYDLDSTGNPAFSVAIGSTPWSTPTTPGPTP
ncbi:MAG: cytochrome c [Verrucomicrobiales bacterium]